jgi:3-phosphoshikimate 1-carboxyvinyltransferase
VIARGRIAVPGDKSITHRALMLAALTDGVCRFDDALSAGDTRATASCLRALGVVVSPLVEGRAVTVQGRGLRPFRRPARMLDCRNSGTTARLLMGLLSAHRFAATLTGDASLRRRPMARVAGPLEAMGSRITTTDGRLPVTVRGGELRDFDYQSPVASAQVKTALLFAGLAGGVRVSVTEPVRSRDHSERLLAMLGAGCGVRGNTMTLDPVERLPAFSGAIPGDFSSAAYLVAAALLAERSELRIENVNVNPTRTGFLLAVERMGATVEIEDRAESLGEPIGVLVPRTSHPAPRTSWAPVTVEPDEIPSMVDEIPLLACLTSRAEGTSVFRGVGELRVKESDRLALVAKNLVTLGVRAHTEEDTLWVEGTDRPPIGRIETAGDHRLAMSFAVLGTLPGASVTLDDRDCVAISYPSFFTDLRRILRRA